MDWLGVHYPNMLELWGLNQPYSGLQRVKIWSCDLFASLYLAGWWFGTFLFSTIYGIIFPLTNICQDGLKPPTSWCVGRNPGVCQLQCLYIRGYCNCNRLLEFSSTIDFLPWCPASPRCRPREALLDILGLIEFDGHFFALQLENRYFIAGCKRSLVMTSEQMKEHHHHFCFFPARF